MLMQLQPDQRHRLPAELESPLSHTHVPLSPDKTKLNLNIFTINHSFLKYLETDRPEETI